MNFGPRYPFGLHGYHRSGSGGFDVADPLGLGGGDPKYNGIKKQAVDPLGLFYSPPKDPAREAAEQAKLEEARKAQIRDQINKMYGVGDASDPAVQAAQAQLAKEAADVGDATKSYYTDQLNRSYTAAERNTRFNLARQGLLGGSADADMQANVKSDRDLGATRIGEAVRSATTSLQAQRENERLNATGLVNAGVGDEGIRAATTGLQSSLDNVRNASKANITEGLFTGGADNFANQNFNAANAALLARQNQLGAFFQTKPSSGKVTATG